MQGGILMNGIFLELIHPFFDGCELSLDHGRPGQPLISKAFKHILKMGNSVIWLCGVE